MGCRCLKGHFINKVNICNIAWSDTLQLSTEPKGRLSNKLLWHGLLGQCCPHHPYEGRRHRLSSDIPVLKWFSATVGLTILMDRGRKRAGFGSSPLSGPVFGQLGLFARSSVFTDYNCDCSRAVKRIRHRSCFYTPGSFEFCPKLIQLFVVVEFIGGLLD